jgi:(p)ppGpp synthase/HD superfamily hydrolase
MGYEQNKLALEIARLGHQGQFRRDGVTPYINHPIAVAEKVNGELLKAVALLHDILEDTDFTAESLIRRGVHPVVVEAVKVLTKHKGDFYETYLENVKNNDLARTVKIADMLHNLSDNPTTKQIRKYAQGLLYLTS